MESPFDPPREFPPCPICRGEMQLVYQRFSQHVIVCSECHSGLTVPARAWDIAAVKKAQLKAKPDEKAG
jgi:ssDNA-binding Zn-finger/Zn-ribbon topoisomerase 1